MAQALASMRFVWVRRGRRVRRRLAALVAGAAMAALTVAVAGTAMAADAGSGAQAVTPLRITDVSPDGGSLGVPTDTTLFVDFDTRMDTDIVFQDVKLGRARPGTARSSSRPRR
jgi:hypothetical protein